VGQLCIIHQVLHNCPNDSFLLYKTQMQHSVSLHPVLIQDTNALKIRTHHCSRGKAVDQLTDHAALQYCSNASLKCSAMHVPPPAKLRSAMRVHPPDRRSRLCIDTLMQQVLLGLRMQRCCLRSSPIPHSPASACVLHLSRAPTRCPAPVPTPCLGLLMMQR